MTAPHCLKCLKPIEQGSPSKYGLHEKCFLSWFSLRQVEEFVGIERRSVSAGPKPEGKSKGWNTSFFHGKYRKYSAVLASSFYIFKMKEEQAPELPDVEYLCNQIAESVKLPIPNFYFIEFEGERTFVTRNFVMRSRNANLSHIHHYLSDKDSYDCETLTKLILKETGKPYYVDVFLRACLFDSLIGNHDRHGRNLAFIVTSKGMSLSPIYDNPSALGLEYGPMLKAKWEPRGKIATKATDEPTAKDYAAECLRLDHEDTVHDFVAKIHLGKICRLIKESTCSELMKAAIEQLVTRRYEEMNDVTNKRTK